MALLEVVGCSRTPAAAATPVATLEVLFAGCGAVHAGPRCELTEARELTVWVAGADAMSAFADRTQLAFDNAIPIQGGTRYTMHVPIGATFVEFRALGAAAGNRLTVSDAQPSTLLTAVQSLRAQGKYAEARERLENELGSQPAPLQGRARALLARVAFSAGDFESAAQGLRSSMAQAITDGRVSDAVYDATALSYILVTSLRQYTEAHAVLEQAWQLSAQDPASRAILPHYLGLLALESGDMRAALKQFRACAAASEKLGLHDHELLARQKEASTLALLGRHAEAAAAQRQLIDRMQPTDACAAADAHERLAWIALSAEPPANTELAELAEEASAAAARDLTHCASPWRERNHGVNAALLALQRADVPRALEISEQLRRLRGGQDALLLAWQEELRGRIELARDHTTQSLAAFQRALALSSRTGLWENEYLAQLGIGRSEERLGRPSAAMAAYLAADHIVDSRLAGVPLGEGQAGFLREREAAAERLIELYVQSARPADALQIARRSAARLVQSLAQRARVSGLDAPARAQWESALGHYQALRDALERAQHDAWKLPADRLAASQSEFRRRRAAALEALDEAQKLLSEPHTELPELATDEALLAYVPVGTHVFAFFAYHSQLVVRTLVAVDPSQSVPDLSIALLTPVRPELDSLGPTVRLRVLTTGELAAVDVHALELDGAPLIARFEISYSLDVPRKPAPERTREGTLVVADPSLDLPMSAREGEFVAHTLGHQVTQLARSDARRDLVLNALPTVSLFHYAGHGKFAGLEGIDSGLQLSDGLLSLGDVLTLRSVPPLVVLSACDAAHAEAAGFAGSLNLAQAFVVAGAETVVAATRPIADQLTRTLLEAFYRAHGGAAGALRHAQLELHANQPRSDWASFRAITP